MSLRKLSRSRTFLLFLVLVLSILPMTPMPQYMLYVITIGMVFVMLTCSWDILTGYSGQVSFGHAGFFGIGAYTSVLMIYHFKLNPWLAFVLGPIGATLLGLMIGLICLRLRGPYLALMTLAVTQVVELLIIMNTKITRGELGISGYRGLLSAQNQVGYYYLALALAGAVVAGLYLFGESRHGLLLRTVREDELKAQSMGINTVRYKLMAFLVSSCVAGLSGSFYAFFVKVLSPAVFDVRFSSLPIGLTIMGGAGTILGPAVFALLFQVVAEALTKVGVAYDLAVLGLLIVASVSYLPRGLWPLIDRYGKSGKSATPGASGRKKVAS